VRILRATLSVARQRDGQIGKRIGVFTQRLGQAHDNVEPSVSAQLEVIMDTDKYTPHAFAIHPDVDAETRKRIAQALISLGDSEEGRALLAGIKFDGIEAAEDSEWHDVRGLNMDPINFED
jgi:ABC-type phosphate/phosphonate transport system substrate-binding protein